VSCVSWNDAKAYLSWLSEVTGVKYRLPTAAEWEYAARAGTQTARFWGDDSSQACRFANVSDRTPKHVGRDVFNSSNPHPCSDGQGWVAPVGSFSANSWGLFDMLGNVLEWTEDCGQGVYGVTPTDGSAWTRADCTTREMRGGSYRHAPAEARAASRVAEPPEWRYYFLGFRVARGG
jgi:formylglycine-generating enzyme required for sulfatase activity